MQIFPPKRAFAMAGLFFVMLNVMLINCARAGDPKGIWLIGDRDAEVQVATCGEGLCATVVWIQQPNDPANKKPWVDKNNIDSGKRSRPLFGITIANDMRASEIPDKWTGQIYSVVRVRIFMGSLTLLSPTKLKIEGCLVPMICQSEIWTKQIDGGNAGRSNNVLARQRRD